MGGDAGRALAPTVAILEELKRAGYELHGLSNWSAEKFALVSGKDEFFSWFGAIVISGEVGLGEPYRGSIRRCCGGSAGRRGTACSWTTRRKTSRPRGNWAFRPSTINRPRNCGWSLDDWAYSRARTRLRRCDWDDRCSYRYCWKRCEKVNSPPFPLSSAEERGSNTRMGVSSFSAMLAISGLSRLC